jgi:hypothetical protein
MTDIRADETPPGSDEDRLPWLEAVEEEEESEGPSLAKLVAFVVIGLAAIGLIVGGLFWIGNRGQGGEGGEPELIAAPEGDYKVKPEEPGGMQVEGTGDTAFATSEGAVPKASIDTSAVPEKPVTEAPPPADKAPAPAAKPKPAPAAPAKPAAAPGGTIQLGAFSTQGAANNAWKALSGRFSYLAPLSHNVTPVESGGRTLYRLRATGPDASGICGRLRVAGESCVVID